MTEPTPDPSDHIRELRDYIRARYGSPEGMRASWARTGWYDEGGILPPGVTRVVNNTGDDEEIRHV